MAKPHLSDKILNHHQNDSESNRYTPLLRGLTDIPVKGEQVLLCTIGGVQYYLGPLNTENNPNFNSDTLFSPEMSLTSNVMGTERDGSLRKGNSKNFERIPHIRMSKIYNPKLDSTSAYNETHGDMMLEGRHGNSIRIGSRSDNPYIYISNGRSHNFQTEGFADGSLIAITKEGSLNQHFGGYFAQKENKSDKPDGAGDVVTINGFTLASDFVNPVTDDENPKRLMSKLISSVNGDIDVNQFIYQYGSEDNQNQMLFYSDRIIINTKSDDIYLSSKKDIHIGARRHLTISTSENLIVESEKTYLGDPNKKTMDNMVLGKKLTEVLESIVDIFDKIQVMTQLGPQKILPNVQPDLNSIRNNINSILSNKHFLEE